MPDFHFITSRLALGGAIGSAEKMQEIAESGITHIVNLQAEFDDRSIVGDTGIEVLWIEITDDFLPKPPTIFWKAVEFTQQALRTPRTSVLFHCAAGIHRSPMVLLAVLRVLGHNSENARHLIAIARSQVDFPPVYIESVEDFYREYLACLEEAEAPPDSALSPATE